MSEAENHDTDQRPEGVVEWAPWECEPWPAVSEPASSCGGCTCEGGCSCGYMDAVVAGEA